MTYLNNTAKRLFQLNVTNHVIALSFLVSLCLFSSISSAATKNLKPKANAGSDQQVTLSNSVNLNGSNSTDNDGVIKKYQWTQTLGTKVKLFSGNTATPSFISPALLKKKTTSVKLTFKLVVTDNKKASASDTVNITVTDAPVCFLPKVLKNNQCVLPPPSCTAPKVFVNNLCTLVCTNGQVIENGICVTAPPICAAPKILQNGVCAIPTPVCQPPQVLQYNQCITASSLIKFNDTGMTACSEGTEGIGSQGSCGNGRFPGQDAEFGRDSYIKNEQDGHAGFSFTKISQSGAELPSNAIEWACVKDNVTGLLWEVKTDDGGLHDKDLGYSYYSTSHNPKNEFGSATDASGFINTVNQQGLCGTNDWRLPTTQELLGIVDFSVNLPGPSIDRSYFPNNRSNLTKPYPFETHYWTASTFTKSNDKAWVVLFADGSVYDDDRQRVGGAGIRLVRGTNSTTSNTRFHISEDGQEVTDQTTGLIWRRCVEGMNWNGNVCTGEFDGFMFEEALQKASAQALITGKNWRLPNTKELASLIDPNGVNILIDRDIFPATPNFQSWTSTAYTQDGFFAWVVNFYYGWVYFSYTEDTGTIRLVRDGQ